MMKIKEWMTSKSLLTFISILSVLLAFSVLCGVALWCLHSLGVVSFPSKGKTVWVPEGTGGAEQEFPVFTKYPPKAVGVIMDDSVYEKMLTEIPFSDSYYMKLRVQSYLTDAVPVSGVYEIWRYGDKYRMNRYNEESGEVEYTVICDANRVQITDFDTTSIVYDTYSDAYAFSEMIPVPNFSKLFETAHEFLECTESNNTCIVSCEYRELGIVDTIEFSKSTGMLFNYKRFQNNQAVLSVELESSDSNFVFSDYMFVVD